MTAAAERHDIQAIVKTGFGSLNGAAYLPLRIADADAARVWLRTPNIASVSTLEEGHVSRACQIAFTAAGLRALGLDKQILTGFAPEFVEGLSASERRSHRLGDAGVNAPQRWDWGYGETEPHILLALFDQSDDAAASWAETLAADAVGQGCLKLRVNRTGDMGGREPFGFADGVSQPEPDWTGAVKPGGARDRIFHNTIAAGEILLGYENEYGLITDRPVVDAHIANAERLAVAPDMPGKRDLGRNGTYLVYRQLAQDVRGFWRWLHATAGGEAVAMAEKMVGRRMDGSPLAGLPPARIAGVDDAKNKFLYPAMDGAICPFGAHIRRANPRTGDDPEGHHGFFRDLLSSLGLKGTAQADAVASTRFHRVLRRGREYGAWLAPEDAARPDAPDPGSGLHFICLNANLARQFEFVQGAWIANAKFGGRSGEQDPLLGNRIPFPADQATDAFGFCDAQGNPCLAGGLPQFVTVKGGAYFFLPGLRALDWILG